MFNEEFKKRFMTNYDESTQLSLSFIFKRSAELENMLGKDIYEMNREELDDLFMSFGCRSDASVATRISVVNKYIDFAIEEGFVPSKFNLVNNFSGEEYYKRYVSKVAENRKILNKEEFLNLIDYCVNAQDAALFVLIYNSGRGRQIKEHALEELKNLKWEDCSEENNTVTFTKDNGETRTVNVEPYVIEILKDANAQERYVKSNGEVNDWLQVRRNTELELYQTGYILKPTKQGVFGKMTTQNIGQRIKNIKTLYGNPYISITNIWVSGMIDYAKQIKRKKGIEKLAKEDILEICRRFDIEEIYWVKTKQKIEKYL
jgi:integrase